MKVVWKSMLFPASPWMCRYHGPLRRWYPTITLHGVKTEKTIPWKITAMKEAAVNMYSQNLWFLVAEFSWIMFSGLLRLRINFSNYYYDSLSGKSSHSKASTYVGQQSTEIRRRNTYFGRDLNSLFQCSNCLRHTPLKPRGHRNRSASLHFMK